MADIKLHKCKSILDEIWDEGEGSGDLSSGRPESSGSEILEKNIETLPGKFLDEGKVAASSRIYLSFERHIFLQKLALSVSVSVGKKLSVSDAMFYVLGPGISKYCPQLKDEYKLMSSSVSSKKSYKRKK